MTASLEPLYLETENGNGIASTLKVCCYCHVSQPNSNFTKDKNRSDGLYPQCRTCVRNYRDNTCPRCKGKKDKRAKRCSACLNDEIDIRTHSPFRRCQKCARVFPISQFGVNNSRPDGLQNWCSECMRTHTNGRRKEQSSAELNNPERVCNRCGVSKPRSEFHKHVVGRRWTCISCCRLEKENRTHKQCSNCKQTLPIEQFNKRGSRKGDWNHTCKTCQSFESINRRDAGKEWYESTLKSQGYNCAICGSAEPRGRGSFNLDHDHSCCGAKQNCSSCRRGLLCQQCNHALGWLENKQWVESAIKYLHNFGSMLELCWIGERRDNAISECDGTLRPASSQRS
jgi:hypothetical protein